jgi:hypothetical protein
VNITLYSFVALTFLYFLSYVCSYLFKIRSDKFYKWFHFAGGYLIYIFTNSLINNWLISLIITIFVGIAWEIYEWLSWKYIFKRKLEKPQKKDTIDDLIKDFLGGLSAFGVNQLIQIILKFFPS